MHSSNCATEVTPMMVLATSGLPGKKGQRQLRRRQAMFARRVGCSGGRRRVLPAVPNVDCACLGSAPCALVRGVCAGRSLKASYFSVNGPNASGGRRATTRRAGAWFRQTVFASGSPVNTDFCTVATRQIVLLGHTDEFVYARLAFRSTDRWL